MGFTYTKYKKEHEFYHSFLWEKVSYRAFFQRIVKQKRPMERAIQKINWRQSKFEVNDTWRVCTKCLQFQTWECFSKDVKHTRWHSGVCRTCNAERKKQYRQTEAWRIRTKNYKIIYRSDPKNKAHEKQVYRERQQKNRERLSAYMRDITQKNKEKINSRRRQLTAAKFRPWAKVIFWKVHWVVKEYKKWKGCLTQLENWMRIWIWRYRLKSVKKRFNFSTFK